MSDNLWKLYRLGLVGASGEHVASSRGLTLNVDIPDADHEAFAAAIKAEKAEIEEAVSRAGAEVEDNHPAFVTLREAQKRVQEARDKVECFAAEALQADAAIENAIRSGEDPTDFEDAALEVRKAKLSWQRRLPILESLVSDAELPANRARGEAVHAARMKLWRDRNNKIRQVMDQLQALLQPVAGQLSVWRQTMDLLPSPGTPRDYQSKSHKAEPITETPAVPIYPPRHPGKMVPVG